MEEEYTALLDRALEKLPKREAVRGRFDLPLPECVRRGGKTAVTNFIEISKRLNRDPKHLLKFLTKELATAATIVKENAVFQGRFTEDTVARLIKIYTERYVTCPICKSPDTKIVKEGKFHFLVCEACGAKSSILES